MLDVIQYIFDTEQDTQLYFNQKNLMADLLEQNFTMDEINQAINWFYPIVDAGTTNSHSYDTKSIRALGYMESKYLSKSIMNRILAEEKHGKINAFQRDLLIDRLSIVAMETDEIDIDHIFDKLLLHFSNYTFSIKGNNINQYQTLYNGNFTTH